MLETNLCFNMESITRCSVDNKHGKSINVNERSDLRRVNAMFMQILNHVQMAVCSSPIGAPRSAMNAVSGQISDHS